MNRNYIVCNKVKATDVEGYLFLLDKGNAKNRVKRSLGIKVNYKLFCKHWSKKEQRYMSGMPDYKKLNDELQNKLLTTQTTIEADSKKHIEKTSKDKTSFLDFWQSKLNEIKIVGTRTKYETEKVKFEKFIKSLDKTDISFSDLTPEFVLSYQHYLQTTKDPKQLAPNQVNHYLKTLQNFINKKVNKDPYTFSIHPFTGFEFEKRTETKRRVLHNDEYERVIFTEVNNKELSIIRDAFLFMVFSGGMRVGEMLTLRWNTITSNYIPPTKRNNPNINMGLPGVVPMGKDYEPVIDYVILKGIKTKKIELSFYSCKILMRLLNKEDLINNIIYESYTNPLLHKVLNNVPMTLQMIKEEIDKHIFNIGFEYVEYRGFKVHRDNDRVKALIDCLETEKQRRISNAVEISTVHIYNHIHRNNSGENFVFPFLNNEGFSNLSNNDNDFKRAIVSSNDLTRLVYNAEKKYNHGLSDLSKYFGLAKINPHAARHTTAQRLITEGENLFSIQQSLGHSSPVITETYTKGKDFKVKDKDNAVKKIGNKTDFI